MNYAHVDLPNTSGSIVWLGLLALVLSTFLPGFMLACRVNKNKSNASILTASPMLGLVVVFALMGILFISNLYSIFIASLVLLVLNIFAVIVSKDDIKSIFSNIGILEFNSNSKNFMFGIFFLASLSVLSPIFMFKFPYGVDWIGFSTLSTMISSSGTLEYGAPNLGNWLYPPAFLSVCSFYSTILAIPEYELAFILGFYSLFCILLGIYSLFERERLGNLGGILAFLSLGLFAKTFDSGWPTIASFIPLLMGIFGIIESNFELEKYDWKLAILALITSLLLHPTGFISLCLIQLLFLVNVSGLNLLKTQYKSIILALILTFTSLFFISRMVNDSVIYSEYGWQGGLPLLLYNFPLILVALFFGAKNYNDRKVKLFSSWFFCLWILSFVNLLHGLSELSIVRLFSYIFYSMGVHTFQIPLILVAGYGIFSSIDTTEIESQELRFHPKLKKISFSFSIILLLLIPSGLYLLADVSKNEHHFGTTESMLRLIHETNSMEIESVVFTENSHWGFLHIEEIDFETTSLPNLGLMESDYTLQHLATNAIKRNDFDALSEMRIEYAISSPMGSLHWLLSSLGTWDVILDHDGARLWKINPNGSENIIRITSDSGVCSTGICEEITGLWTDSRFLDPYGLGDNRTKMMGESVIDIDVNLSLESFKLCILYEVRGEVKSVRFLTNLGDVNFDSSNGWHLQCVVYEEEVPSTASLQVDAKSSSFLFNPSYFSGRSANLFEEPGILIHHIEIHN